MAANQLSAEVTIDIKGAEASLKGLGKLIDALGKDMGKVTAPTVAAEKAVTSVGKAAAVTAPQIKRVDTALKPVAKTTGSATQALTNFNRVVQDAPFGIIGIANNIDPLVQSFQKLKAESGSTGAAIKSLVATVGGPTGVLFLFSALSTAATVLVQKYGSLGNAYDVLTGKTKALTEEDKKRKEELAGIVSSLAEEATRVTVLKSAIESETLSKKERAGAIKELQKINPKYFGDLKDEKGLIDSLTIAYNGYIESLKRQFAAKALDKRIADLFEKKIDLEIGISEASRSRAAREMGGVTKKEAARFAELLKKPFLELNDEEKKFFDRVQSRISSVKTFDLGFGETEAQLKGINRQIEELLRLRTDLGEFNISVDKDSKERAIKDIEQTFDAATIKATPNIVVLPSGIEIQDGLMKINQMVQQAIDTNKAIQNIQFKPLVIVKPEFKIDDKELRRLLATLNNILAGGVIDAFSAIGEGIGNAIGDSANALTNLAKGFLGAFGSLISSIGKALLEYGIVKTGLDKIIAGGIAIPGAVAIAAGIAAIAIGRLVATAIPKFAQGGIVTGPTLGMIGEAGQPEVVLPLNKLDQFFRNDSGGGGFGTGIIRGQQLLFIQNRAARSAARTR